MTAVIYTLSDPRNSVPRYIGKTTNAVLRMKEHLKATGSTKRAKWIGSLLRDGVEPVLEAVEVVQGSWQEAEVYWIAQFRAWGFNLLNGDNGGLGSDRLPEDVKVKISASLSGRPNMALARSVAQYDKKGKLLAVHKSLQIAAKATSTHHANIIRAIARNNGCGGYLWRYGEDATQTIDSPYVDGRIPVSEITKHLLSTALKGKPGKRPSAESRLKMSISARNRKCPSPL